MRIYVGGKWVDRDDKIEVSNPSDNAVIDTVPRAGIEDVAAVVASAERGTAVGALPYAPTRSPWGRSRSAGYAGARSHFDRLSTPP